MRFFSNKTRDCCCHAKTRRFFVLYQPPEKAVILIGVGQGVEWWQERKPNSDDRIVRVKKHADA